MPSNAAGVVALLGRQERARRVRVAEPAAHQHLRDRRADAELTLEPHAVRERRSRDVEPRLVHAAEPRRRQDGTRA